MNTSLEQYAQALQERVKEDKLRSLRPSRPLPFGQIELNGKTLVNFASNDYLGLSQHPLLIERSREYAQLYGAGSGSSRLLSGNLSVFEMIESKLARLKGSESALILPSGFQANSSLIPTLLNAQSLAAADRFVHRSMIEGLLLSSAKWFRFEHNNFDDLQKRLQSKLDREQPQEQAKSGWLLSESVFSADGDRLDMNKAIAFAGEHGLALYIDEAHATGVVGDHGMGLSAGLKVPGVVMGTFGKGLGSFGAYVCCSSLLREYLVNFCPGLIYSTALPPPVLGAIDAALDLVPSMDKERELLLDNAESLRMIIQRCGFDTAESSTQIIPIVVGDSGAALSLSAFLETEGFYVPAIRPPTVPEGAARLRLSLSAVHTRVQIEEFGKVLRKWHEKNN